MTNLVPTIGDVYRCQTRLHVYDYRAFSEKPGGTFKDGFSFQTSVGIEQMICTWKYLTPNSTFLVLDNMRLGDYLYTKIMDAEHGLLGWIITSSQTYVSSFPYFSNVRDEEVEATE